MGELLKAIIEKLESPFFLRWALPFILLLTCLTGFAILHPPAPLATDIDVSTLPKATRSLIAIATMTSGLAGCLLIVFLIVNYAISHWQKTWNSKLLAKAKANLKEQFFKELDTLGQDEKQFLGVCLSKNVKTVTTLATCPTAIKLSQRGMLTQQNGVVSALNFPFTIHPVLWELLTEHKEIFLDNWGLSNADDEDLSSIWQELTSAF